MFFITGGAVLLSAIGMPILKESKSAGSTGEKGIPDTRWMVGSNVKQTDAQMQFKGVMKSFRIYNRVLTAEEVAANAAVDAARFEGVMPVTNAVVATSAAGAFGNEAPGVYAVDGSHTFTAQPSAKDGSRPAVREPPPDVEVARCARSSFRRRLRFGRLRAGRIGRLAGRHPQRRRKPAA